MFIRFILSNMWVWRPCRQERKLGATAEGAEAQLGAIEALTTACGSWPTYLLKL